MFLGIKPEGWLTIAAIVLGPMLAFGVQNWRDIRREDRNRKRQIFHQLLLTMKVPMAPRHVDALNSIPLEFNSSASVTQAWREYTAHLNDSAMIKANPVGWGERKFELLITLVYEMGNSLGYDHIDKTTLRTHIYVPQGYEDTEEQFRQIRTKLLQVLGGERPIPMTMVGPVQVEEPLPAVEELPPAPRQATLPARTNSR
jgi:hypothetical protein